MCLQVVTNKLGIRLSYHDMRMFAAILQSLPDQLRAALPGKIMFSHGFLHFLCYLSRATLGREYNDTRSISALHGVKGLLGHKGKLKE